MWCSGKGGVEVLQHTHDVLALAWAPSGKMLASATLDGQIYLWDPLEAELLVSGAFCLCIPAASQHDLCRCCAQPQSRPVPPGAGRIAWANASCMNICPSMAYMGNLQIVLDKQRVACLRPGYN